MPGTSFSPILPARWAIRCRPSVESESVKSFLSLTRSFGIAFFDSVSRWMLCLSSLWTASVVIQIKRNGCLDPLASTYVKSSQLITDC